MYKKLQPVLQKKISEIKEANLYKKERIITTPQGAVIKTTDGKEVINFCANNYLGLSAHPRIIDAAKRAIDTASPRRIAHPYGLSDGARSCHALTTTRPTA